MISRANGKVLNMMQPAVADGVFLALSSSVRRKILEQLSSGPATVSDLAAPFDMKLPSFMESGWRQGTDIATEKFVAHVLSLK